MELLNFIEKQSENGDRSAKQCKTVGCLHHLYKRAMFNKTQERGMAGLKLSKNLNLVGRGTYWRSDGA